VVVVAAAAELGVLAAFSLGAEETKEMRRWYIRPRGMVVVVVANPLEGVETLGLV
jgi:hypothetical protein